MKKIFFLLAGALSLNAVGQISNGGFETFGTLPTCPSSFPIANASSWNGLKTTYTSSCTYTDAISTEPDYFNSTTGGTSSCQPAGSAARTGTGFAHIEYRGFYPFSTAKSEFIYQQVGVTSGRKYKLTAYVNSLSTTYPGPGQVRFCMVNTSVGSTASNILNDVRFQAPSSPISTDMGSGWYKIEKEWTAPSTGNYYLVIGSMLFCNDESYSILHEHIVDDVSMQCAAYAGSDVSFTCSCCVGGCSGVGIGISTSGSTYSWSPTSGLSSSTIANPTATPTSSTTYTLTVSGSDCTTSTDAVYVQKIVSTSCCPPKAMLSNTHFDDNSVSLFPNPSIDGKYNVSINTKEVSGRFQVFDLTGKIVNSGSIDSNTFSLDLSSLPKGNYYVQIEFNGNMLKRTLIFE